MTAKRILRRMIHKTILWYVNRVGGAFHVNAYGPDGRYIVALSEGAYHRTKAAETNRAFWMARDKP